MKLKRIIEFTVGVLIALFPFAIYNNANGQHFLIDFVIPYPPIKFIIIIDLFITASKLIGGPPKDYSKIFYSFLINVFGDPAKAIKN